MNDDQPDQGLEALRAEHRDLDQRIRELVAEPIGDQLEIARMKRRSFG